MRTESEREKITINLQKLGSRWMNISNLADLKGLHPKPTRDKGKKTQIYTPEFSKGS